VRRWLADSPPPPGWIRAHLGPVPIARPAAAAAAVPLLGWNTLGRLLAGEPRPDVLVIARNELLDVPAPQSLPALRALMDRGVGVVLRRAERGDAALAALARSFLAELGGEVHIQVFVTPGGSYGFGWHYDVEHVFIVQTAGVKDYYFRANTVSPPFESPADFGRFEDERSPLATARLLPGDWLYIPSRWWHSAKCIEDSLSISIGVRL
jgi:hypothetical protein